MSEFVNVPLPRELGDKILAFFKEGKTGQITFNVLHGRPVGGFDLKDCGRIGYSDRHESVVRL